MSAFLGPIHYWLKNKIQGQQDNAKLGEFKNIFSAKGVEKRKSLGAELNVIELYKVIQDTLLNGMPCDHAEAVVTQSDTEVVWQRRVCVHKEYWDEVGKN